MESRNSFVSRMRGCELPAEKACFIFSIINMIIVSICLAACIYYIAWIEYLKLHNAEGLAVFFNLIFGTIAGVCTGISFVFAVLLCYGAHKKRPKFLLTYFVFGVIVEILSTLGVIFYLMDYTHDLKRSLHIEQIILVSVALTIMAIYILPLTVVYRAYRILSDTTVLSNCYSKLMHIYPPL